MKRQAEDIRKALAGDQDAYTRLHRDVLRLARICIRRYRILYREAHFLIYDATTHVLIHLGQCPQPEYFVPWARKVVARFYQCTIRNMLTLKGLILLDAKPLGTPEYEDSDGDAKWLQLAETTDHVKQLDAHIDATYVLGRLQKHMQKVAVRYEMYGYQQPANGMMTQVRHAVKTGVHLNRPRDQAFALPGIVM